jgi:GTPase involved in cell partitioning and DNA repair
MLPVGVAEVSQRMGAAVADVAGTLWRVQHPAGMPVQSQQHAARPGSLFHVVIVCSQVCDPAQSTSL